MSENGKDNNNFEFIKEQVIEKKRRKIRRKLLPPLKTVGFAVLFGLTAAATFAIVEPKISRCFNKEVDTKTPVSFPTQCPQNIDNQVNTKPEPDEPEAPVTQIPNPTPVIVEQSIDADVDDYLSMNQEIRKVANEVSRSILNITSTFSVKDIFGKNVTKTVNLTGVIIYNNSKELLVVVSLDRVKDADSIKVVFSDVLSADAALQDYESDINLAVVAVPIADIPEVYMNNMQVATLGESYTVTEGLPVIALGNPNGYPGSMEIGMITSSGSYASITDNHLDLFNTDIEDNKNSDGIIINLKGEIIGLITRTLKEDNNANLSTAVGISKLKPILTAMGNKEPRTYFGVITGDMTDSTKKEYNIENGIYVNDVQADSPAFKAGIQNGDIILGINDESILNTSDFNDTITDYKPGSKINVKIKRDNGSKEAELNLEVELAEKAE